MKKLPLPALLLVTGACATGGAPPPSGQALLAAETEIAETVFRYQLDHNASALGAGASRYCLALPGERSPDPAFLRRFAGHTPPVVGAGECERKSGHDLFFRIERLDWRSGSEVWVSGGYREASRRASDEIYRVRLQDGRWVVDGARWNSLS